MTWLVWVAWVAEACLEFLLRMHRKTISPPAIAATPTPATIPPMAPGATPPCEDGAGETVAVFVSLVLELEAVLVVGRLALVVESSVEPLVVPDPRSNVPVLRVLVKTGGPVAVR